MECEEVTTQRGPMGELQPQTRLLLIARFLVALGKMGSLCSPGSRGTRFVSQVSLEVTESPLPLLLRAWD